MMLMMIIIILMMMKRYDIRMLLNENETVMII